MATTKATSCSYLKFLVVLIYVFIYRRAESLNPIDSKPAYAIYRAIRIKRTVSELEGFVYNIQRKPFKSPMDVDSHSDSDLDHLDIPICVLLVLVLKVVRRVSARRPSSFPLRLVMRRSRQRMKHVRELVGGYVVAVVWVAFKHIFPF